MARVYPGKKGRSERQDTCTHSPHYSLSAALGVELFHEGIDMKFDRVFADLQAIGNKFVGQAFGEVPFAALRRGDRTIGAAVVTPGETREAGCRVTLGFAMLETDRP